MASRDDLKIQDPQRYRPRSPRTRTSRRTSRRRFWLRRIGVLLLIFLLWLTWSIGSALTAPGTDTTAARLAEWGRFHGLGWVISSLEQAQYSANPPKVGGSLAGGIPRVGSAGPGSGQPTKPAGYLTPPSPIPSQAQPALSGEGTWQTLANVHGQPAIRAAFLRPDSQHTSYLVGVIWMNQNLVKTTLHPGYTVPGVVGSESSQITNAEKDALLATFNSGFTMVDANGGYWQDGRTVVPLQQGGASMVFYKDGHMNVANWNSPTPGPDVAAVRQNLVLLIDNGVISPTVNSPSTTTWGATLGNKTYVWRSAVGIRKDGSLIYVAGASLSVATLASILHGAGAVRAMELDINPDWTNFITYSHPSPGVVVPQMLTKDEQPNPYRYLQPSSRDFVAVLAR